MPISHWGGGSWTPIGVGSRTGSTYTDTSKPFRGTFDGGNHTISGLRISSGSGDEAVGLFGIVAGGTVKDLALTDILIDLSNNELAGGIAGMVCEDGTIEGCVVGKSNDGSMISNKDSAGGIVGKMPVSGSIIDCENFASISSNGKAAGIIAAAYYKTVNEDLVIENCVNHGSIKGVGYTAGIAGLSSANVGNCINYGDITSIDGTGVGGIIGEQKNYGTVTDCVNFGDISHSGSKYGTGGIVGWARYYDDPSFTGYKDMISVEGCVNLGTIGAMDAEGSDAGGIVGTFYNWGMVRDCVNLAENLYSSNFVAGIVGNYQLPDPSPSGIETNDMILEGNTSTTTLNNMTGLCKGLYVYDNPGSIKGTPSTNVLPEGFVIPTIPRSIDEEKNFKVEGDEVSLIVGDGSVIDNLSVDLDCGSVIIKDGTCTAGTLKISIKQISTSVVSGASVTYNVDLGWVVSQSIYMTFNVSVPSGMTPSVYSMKDGAVVKETVVSYTSTSVTILTDHNTPFSIVLTKDAVFVPPYDEGDDYYPLPTPGEKQQDTGSDNDVLKVAVAAVAAMVVIMAAMVVVKKK